MNPIPEDDLIAEIDRLADGSTPPTKREYEQYAEYSSGTVHKKFGTWNDAVREAGYLPHVLRNIPAEDLLRQLRESTSGHIAQPQSNFNGEHETTTYERRFGTWWKSVVKAGLYPPKRRPLTHQESQQFFEAATDQQSGENQLIALLTQFTGLPPEILSLLNRDWVTFRPTSTVVTVPETETVSNSDWTFQIPSAWSDEGKQRETGLSGLLQWYFDENESMQREVSSIRNAIPRVADEANIRNREQIDHAKWGTVPLVRSGDLRTTGGIQMARNGAPERHIRRHLGIEHTGWQAKVEDFFLWLYVHEGYEHPEYDPPDVVLDPVSSKHSP